ncbi:cyclin-related 2 family protein [Heterostelium album PN500]|uniref:Cyclin-related 2 family protein n=1 Tax=Heterostelium pallidum (strain ATCC 26659 / Pp 5 / PN500) TaxID=670386 RepID=D3B7I1_HETP5|nr:cyclin-related 2 family protein [Heterostelium album PN500]EFA82724.1 cyclin-related 2 family protein [Heterostelium album PN500]|eukprot:XP_020434841.1 cyclin-related 2 family protein [Heterostelium album PN500]
MKMIITILDLLKNISPLKESTEEGDNLLLEIITQCINKIVANGDQNKQTHEQFYPPNRKLPSITVRDYLQRLFKYSPCSKECFIASLYYIDKLSVECGLSINSYNIHRILITTLVISTNLVLSVPMPSLRSIASRSNNQSSDFYRNVL